ncbi:HNH endonuclease [Chlorogloeopsis sp. ULAP01]|uniref:HNH endonuclease n=1 Tax=Chlorogloeopsis sp. ULAP01 TaxID=3056483 RepID=UPI0025AAD3DF|nr:HNH endonuclease [Chlorogloeopsis sp. ULAP01]MDM9380564.1 HNH endonuclease [Chlorogloeopsis sp. ULAP01]
MVSNSTRKLVRQRARFLCEYCHSPEYLSHIQPQSLGGSDDVENLALACHRCNERRYNFTKGTDPQTQEIVPLFNPRQQLWSKHFIWTVDSLKICAVTSIGRATCDRLDMNDERHDEGAIQYARRFWVEAGWHPPVDDPRQSA